MANVMDTSDNSFGADVLENELPVLVDFTAEWCGPCRQLAPIVEQLATEYGARLHVIRLDIDNNVQTTMQYAVMSIPTLILFKNGKPVERLTGYMPKNKIVEKLDRHV